ncbi:DEAD/DEAH box helicase family protein, partial [Candidatus Woesearchaeota archaeon]|nr:DEAD/DEAH box helicase family protein [Candidatus Woesearchaeota archaeon]
MWNLYQNEKFLEPLKFSNGKSQSDVIKEVLDSIKKGHKVIFIKGVCGTGKSAIALNIARKLGKTSIVVPGKNLQTQYKRDYEKEKYLLKDNKEKLKISVI